MKKSWNCPNDGQDYKPLENTHCVLVTITKSYKRQRSVPKYLLWNITWNKGWWRVIVFYCIKKDLDMKIYE